MGSIHIEARDKILRVKTALITKFAFSAAICLRLRFVDSIEDGLGGEIDTMATDGIRCWYHPEFVLKWSLDEITGVTIHEGLHVAYLHHLRRGTRIPLVWNIAADAVINPIVLEMGAKLPPNGVFIDKYKGWSVERAYDDMIKENPPVVGEFFIPGKGEDGKDGDQDQPGSGKGDKPGKGKKPLWGTVREPTKEDGSPLSGAEKTEMEEETKIIVMQAAEAAKAIGKLPQSLKGLIAAIKQPTVNWQDYIPAWVKGHVPDNYTWVRPNRSIMANYGLYMPRMQMNGCGIGALSIDQSGSVSDKELQLYASEIVGLIEKLNPTKLYIILHDTKVHQVYEWQAGDDFTHLKVAARGGTCIRPTFQKIKELDDEINWMICFTDMEISDFPTAAEAPDLPVLWAATGKDCAPFGTYVPLKDALEVARS